MKDNQYNIPGWNTYVREAHDAARECYLIWIDYGKPHSGIWFDNMCRSRAKFKLALRYCRQHVEVMKADACANSVFDKDTNRFWHDVYKISNVKATQAANVVDGIVGDTDITAMWQQHFEKLYSEKFTQTRKDEFLMKLQSLKNADCASVMFSVSEVTNALSQL